MLSSQWEWAEGCLGVFSLAYSFLFLHSLEDTSIKTEILSQRAKTTNQHLLKIVIKSRFV